MAPSRDPACAASDRHRLCGLELYTSGYFSRSDLDAGLLAPCDLASDADGERFVPALRLEIPSRGTGCDSRVAPIASRVVSGASAPRVSARGGLSVRSAAAVADATLSAVDTMTCSRSMGTIGACAVAGATPAACDLMAVCKTQKGPKCPSVMPQLAAGSARRCASTSHA